MKTTLTIECDIKEAQAILYSASKIIQEGMDARESTTVLDKYMLDWAGNINPKSRSIKKGVV
jgi:hypothetical protein